MVFGVYHHCQQVKKCEKIEEKKTKISYLDLHTVVT